MKSAAKPRKGAIKASADWPRRLAPLLDRLTAHAANAHAAAHTIGAESAASNAEAGPLTVLAAAELWAMRGGSLPAIPAFALWRGLLTALRAALTTPVDDMAPPDIQLVRQGELPFLAGAFFPGLTGSSALLRDAKKLLARKLSDHTDSDGTPHAELLPRLPLWLAPLVRATWWSELADVSLWNGDQQILMRETIEHATPLCRLDGRLAMGNGLAIDAYPLLSAAAAILGLSTDQPAGAYLKAIARASAGQVVKSRPAMSEADVPSTQSDWCDLHCSEPTGARRRTHWPSRIISGSRRWMSPRSASRCSTETGRCNCRSATPCSNSPTNGPASAGSPTPTSITSNCRWKDRATCTVERMVLLSRRDHFLLLADSIAGAPAEKITLRSQFPLAAGITAQADTATREIRLQAGRQKVRAFPLGLACERVQSTPHTFAVADDQLLLEQVAAGTGLVAPVVFQWSPELVKKEAVWRTLTVSEAGKVAPSGNAAGFRLRIGDCQWLVYRSLKKPKDARSVLGHHSWNETVIGRFDKNGDLDPMLMVE